MAAKRKNGRRGSSVFARIALFVATLLGMLMLLFGGAAVYFLWIAPPPEAEAPSSEPEDTVHFSAEDAMTILVIGVSDDASQLGSLLLCRFDPQHDRVSVASLPSALRAVVEGRRDSLQGFYVYGGSLLVMDAAADAAGVPIDRYVRIKAASGAKLIGNLGGVAFDIPEAVDYTSPDGGFSVVANPGQQTIGGAQMIKLLQYQGWESYKGSAEFAGYAMCALIDQHLRPRTLERYDNLFSESFNLVDTSVTILDAVRMRAPLSYLAEKNAERDGIAALVAAETTGMGDTLALSPSSKDALRDAFTP